MALKDWKKQKAKDNFPKFATWKNRANNKLHVQGPHLAQFDFSVELIDDSAGKIWHQKIVLEKHFKTKSEALKFARAYMRKH